MMQPFHDWFLCDWLAITEIIPITLCPYLEYDCDQYVIGFATCQRLIRNLSETVSCRYGDRLAVCWDWSVTSRQIFSYHRSQQNAYKKVSFRIKWATSWQNQQNDCAPSEDLDQPGHPPCLIRAFAVRMKKGWVLSYPLSAQRRLWSDWADAQADLSLRWAHSHIVGFVMRWLELFLYK